MRAGHVERVVRRHQQPHTVYTMRAADGQVLYVGCTWKLPQRLEQHRAGSRWWAETVEVETIECENFIEGRATERALIGWLRPRHNVEHTPDGIAQRAARLPPVRARLRRPA